MDDILNHMLSGEWECSPASSSKILVQELKTMFAEQLRLDRFFMDKHLYRDETETERIQKIVGKI